MDMQQMANMQQMMFWQQQVAMGGMYPGGMAAGAASPGQRRTKEGGGKGSRGTRSRGERRRRGKEKAAAAQDGESQPEGTRHPLLEEARKPKARLDLQEILTIFIEFATDQH